MPQRAAARLRIEAAVGFLSVSTKASKARVVTVLGTTQTLAWGSSYYLPAILAAPIAEDLGLSRALVFGVFSGSLLLTALLGPAAGRAIDQRGGRDVLALSNVIFALGLFLMAFAHGLPMLALSWFIIGIAMAMGLYDAAFAALAGLYGKDARSSIVGITLFAGFASTVGWPLTALMEVEWGWRGACLGWAALHFLFCLPLNRFLIPQAPPPPPKVAAPPLSAEESRERKRDMILLAFVLASASFSSTALGAHLPGLLQSAGTTLAAAIAAGALMGPAQVAARVVEFTIMRKMNPLFSARIAAGVPSVPADCGASEFPQECGLDVWVSYTKGCYLGQEVMARIQSMGSLRRILRRVEGPVSVGLELKAPEGKVAGLVRSAAGDVGLALVSVDLAESVVLGGVRIGAPAQMPAR